MFAVMIVFITIFSLFYFWQLIKFYGKFSEIPKAKNQIPIFGITHNFFGVKIEDYCEIFLNLFSETKQIQKFWFGTKFSILINSPEMFKTILTSPHCLKKPEFIYKSFFCDNSLISSNGSIQEKHRKILNNSMTFEMLNQLNPIINEKVKKFLDKMNSKVNQNVFDIFNDVAACTLEALVHGNFLYDYDCYNSELLEACEKSNSIGMKRLVQPWLSIKLLLKYSQFLKDVQNTCGLIFKTIDNILLRNEYLRIESDDKKGIFIKQLLNLKNNFSEEEIRDEIFILIFAGFETTATTLSICLLLLAMHKTIQQKVIEEIDNANLSENSSITNEETQNFPYIEMVLKEVLRLFPVGPVTARETSEQIKLENFEIPKGTTIALPIFFLHRNESVWGENPKLFDPERFRPENISKIHPYAFLPFSGGKRICIGYKYAMIFMKIFIVKFFSQFEVETERKFDEIELKFIMTLGFKGGYPIKIKRSLKGV